MNMPVNGFTWFMAAAPVLVLMVLMVKFQMGAMKAAPIGFLTAALTAFFIYKASLSHIAMEAVKGVWSALAVLIVIWPAIFLYETVNEAGAFQVFRKSMGQFTKNELLQIMMIGWVFASFLQGITGFGVPVAVGAPLLIGIGVKPFWAVIIPLIAHTWGNTFGTLAAAWDALVIQANLIDNAAMLSHTALWATSFIWIWNLFTGLMLCWFYGKGKALKKGFPAVLVISLIQGGGQMLMGQLHTTLACFLPCCVSLGAILLMGRSPWYRDAWCLEDSPVMERKETTEKTLSCPQNMTMNQAFLPYYALTGITLFVLLVKPVKDVLGQVKIGFAFPEMVTGYGFVDEAAAVFSPIVPFTHAGMFLLLSGVIGFLYFSRHAWIGAGGGTNIWKRTVKKTIPSSVSVICFVAMSKIMSGTGQTTVLAEGIAALFGQGYAALAPIIGLLGAFMTSSNMASNILFGSFQMTTANLLGLDAAAILGAQTAGGAIGSAICPGNIILGTTTAGIMGKEGMVLRKVLPLALSAVAVVGVILFVLLIF